MPTFPTSLAEIATALRGARLDLPAYLNDICDRIEAFDGQLQALLPEPNRRARLLEQASVLPRRFPEPASRPPLYGIPVGVKDIFHVDGFPTRAGSRLAPELLAGPEAACIATLRALGALILGKTVTTEFAYREPGPTRNPRSLNHTPGGSSSGSAAAVAAGFCPLALGTQTIGSVIRPAAFCGIVGLKPSYGRIPTAGVILFSESADHVGLFTQDVAGMRLAASLLCRNWHGTPGGPTPPSPPTLGVPEGPYLAQASPETLAVFEQQLARLKNHSYPVRRVTALEDIESISDRHRKMIAAEMAQVHAQWFPRHEALYRPKTASMIREGLKVQGDELSAARRGPAELRAQLEKLMAGSGIDLWLSPSATGPAPEGIGYTGDPAMNLPWTHAGLPTITLPSGSAPNGLPLGLQITARYWEDEKLLAQAEPIAEILKGR